MKTHYKYKIISLSLLFTLFIFFSLLNNIFNFVKDIKNNENRALAKEPELDINRLDPFPQQYEKYYNDNFSTRSLLVTFFTNFKLRVYKRSPFPERVVVGNNNWLYTSGGEFDCYLGKNRFTIQELEAYKRDLEFQKKYLEERGCKFYFMITPTKANVHSENIPYSYFRFNKESFGEQLLNYLKANSDINVISVFEPFRKIRENEQIYYKHDNHWNQKGAFYAAEIACSQIAKDFPGIKPLAMSDFIIEEKSRKGGDIARILGNPDSYEDIEYDFVSKKTSLPVNVEHVDYAFNDGVHPQIQVRDSANRKKPKLMMISDSFSYFFFPFLSLSFGRSVNVFDQWHYKLMGDIVAAEKPDVYLLMVYEPFARKVPDNYSRMQKERQDKLSISTK